MNSTPLSIAVVGSGIAGLYCAHRLAVRGHRVTVFEQLPHVGGRIETLNIAGIDCECGPMRFELALQPMLTTLAGELGIQFSPFTPARENRSTRRPTRSRRMNCRARGRPCRSTS